MKIFDSQCQNLPSRAKEIFQKRFFAAKQTFNTFLIFPLHKHFILHSMLEFDRLMGYLTKIYTW
ncbi:MAG: hypothetical protein B5M56_08375 [Desulfococcus sp. 4484_241]|nr:MAG: hypothetical protein B5M56_08375 [Desulfococcus sp. 4484_241]